jgi:hypothetical protein
MQVGMSETDDNSSSTIKRTISVVKHSAWSKIAAASRHIDQ